MDVKARHHKMISDRHRTPLVMKAIRKIVKPGDVVLDLGCGLGITSFEAVKSGAQRVYACDVDREAIREAQKKAKQKGIGQKIVFFNELSSDLYLLDQVDVILAETVGSLGLDENIVPFVIDARERFLKKRGAIIPHRIQVFAAPVELSTASRSFRPSVFVAQNISPKNLLSRPQLYFNVDLYRVKKVVFDGEKKFKVKRSGVLSGFAGWFEVEWAKGVLTSTSPWKPQTHWKQGVLINKKRETIEKGDVLSLRLRILPDGGSFSTQSIIEWGYFCNPTRNNFS